MSETVERPAAVADEATDGEPAIESPAEETAERRSAEVELLWDLVFVFAVTRVTTLLADDMTWAGFGRSMLVLALIWWAWSAFAWVANAQAPDSMSFRLTMLVATVLAFIVALGVPHALGSEALLFAVPYVAVRLLHLLLYVDASRHGGARLRAVAGFSGTVGIGIVLLIAGAAFADGTTRVVLWTAAAAIDYAGPVWIGRDRIRNLQRVAVSHFAERFGLFIIICLGESIVDIGTAVTGEPSGGAVAVVSIALVITIALWWAYFDRAAGLARDALRRSREPVLAASDGYSILHLPLVSGILVFAVGAREAVVGFDHPLRDAFRLALCGGVALYLAGHAAFLWRMLGSVKRSELLAAVVALALFAVSGSMNAIVVCVLLLADLTALALYWTLAGGRSAAAGRSSG